MPYIRALPDIRDDPLGDIGKKIYTYNSEADRLYWHIYALLPSYVDKTHIKSRRYEELRANTRLP